MRLANKTALITGGNSGIGLATARLFAAEGACVAIVGRNKTTLDQAAATLGSNVLAIQADVTDVNAMEQALAAAADRFGKLDIVFANAGIADVSPLGRVRLDKVEVRGAGPRAPVDAGVRRSDGRGMDDDYRRPVEHFAPPPTEDNMLRVVNWFIAKWKLPLP